MCTHNQCFGQKFEKSYNFSYENYHFYSRKILLYIVWACLRNVEIIQLKEYTISALVQNISLAVRSV